MRLVVAVLSLSASCATAPALTCSDLARTVGDLRGKRVVLEGIWVRGQHGSIMCSDQQEVVYLNQIPESWYGFLSRMDAAGMARVRVCGVVAAAERERFRAANPPMASIEPDPSCSSVERLPADGGT